MFIQVGSRTALGDLNQEYRDSLALARSKPDLKALDAQVKAWFDRRGQQGTTRK
ncbi:MAG: hypothetical protein LAP85_06840 [Acidobacteriia bacterium]|nr:hypothetical protein [Terriglobia bacterium]